MMSSGMLHRVTLVRTDVSEELSASFIRVTRNGKLGTTLVVTSVVPSSLTRATRRNIEEDTILREWHVFVLRTNSLSGCFRQLNIGDKGSSSENNRVIFWSQGPGRFCDRLGFPFYSTRAPCGGKGGRRCQLCCFADSPCLNFKPEKNCPKNVCTLSPLGRKLR
jgi:hypothetical protein